MVVPRFTTRVCDPPQNEFKENFSSKTWPPRDVAYRDNKDKKYFVKPVVRFQNSLVEMIIEWPFTKIANKFDP